MPLISPKDENLLEPLAEELANRLSSNFGLTVDRFRLREFLFSRAKKKILDQHPDWSEKGKLQIGALQRLSEVNAIVDLKNPTPEMIDEIISFLNEPPPIVTPPSVAFYPRFNKHPVKEIDQKVGSFGKTRLHLAVDAQNLEEIKRLVEQEGANVHVKDNAGLTPWDRANLADFTEIARYLANF
jgi:ankyrin repeat protein